MNADALVIIDMLNDFTCSGGALYVGDTVKRIVPEIQKKLAHARAESLPVFYICDRHAPNDAEFEMFPPHCIEGERGAEIHKDLRPSQGDSIVSKTKFSAFFNTNFHDLLQEKHINSIELCGVCTNICVLFTAADARMRGYQVSVDRRCVDSYDHAAHEFALKEMDRVLGVKIA